ncbi:MAG: hypothetical protein Q8O28_08560 [Smithellaceae bacterium]|nr:hypothetical protein [Smithellaceae bacterium]
MSHHHRHGSRLVYFALAKKIFKNKTFLLLALALLLIALAVGIWLISLLIPFLGQLLTNIEKNGLKGIIEAISPYLLKLWEGAGK